jgi:hypothetical protein
MKKTFLLTFLIMSLSLVLFSFANANKNATAPAENVKVASIIDTTAVSEAAVSLSTQIYNELQLDEVGLSVEALEYAIEGYEKLLDKGLVNQDQYLTIVDFSQHSRKKRLYILDMAKRKLVWNTFVSHGKNTGVDVAKNFSNQISSEKSSLGFYLTSQTYNGKHGLSMRLKGLEKGFNDNAEARGIVVHGASYVNAGRVNSAYMGRSQGCPALPENEYAKVINIIKGGSVLFIYHPSQNYLRNSPILNS